MIGGGVMWAAVWQEGLVVVDGRGCFSDGGGRINVVIWFIGFMNFQS